MGIRTRWQLLDPAVLRDKAWRTLKANWHLGFTAFGGPPVHFKILHDKFVNKLGWIDEQLYQELFSVSQAFSGPASTKMLYGINLIYEGTLSAVLAFLLWSLPGALGMLGLSIGVSNIGENLPAAVYALLSGLNASTVGIIALAAVQLSRKAITDKLTRLLVYLGACAGMLYNALWYFPLLIFLAGVATVVYDGRWLHGPVRAVARLVKRRRGQREAEAEVDGVEMQTGREQAHDASGDGQSIHVQSRDSNHSSTRGQAQSQLPVAEIPVSERQEEEARVIPADRRLNMSWKAGLLTIGLFLLSFIVIMVLRGVLETKSLLYSLFANLYLAGTIIFGGGPVVIPLLREYVVAEGWVSPRDFLIGLAIIQGFPGPNFNFAVYLGGLTAINAGYSVAAGAVIGYVGIFAPGMILCHGIMGVWSAIRGKPLVKSALRGLNAAAVGLIYTAVYRLWQIGYVDEGFGQGASLGNDPWWVVVTATSYVGGSWFGLSPPAAIVLGAVMGLIRYGIVSKG
ncbi:hypothetical protein AAE478_009221 [Parahypoxylon ruwenzoriense]